MKRFQRFDESGDRDPGCASVGRDPGLEDFNAVGVQEGAAEQWVEIAVREFQAFVLRIGTDLGWPQATAIEGKWNAARCDDFGRPVQGPPFSPDWAGTICA